MSHTSVRDFTVLSPQAQGWMLTGVYTLRNAACTDASNASLGAEVSVGSTLMEAAMGVPVGSLAKVAVEKVTEMTVQWPVSWSGLRNCSR